VNEPRMTRKQQKRINAMLGDLEKQVKWSVNGSMRSMCKEDWRRFMAAHVRRQPTCPSIDGDFLVVLSVSTKGFTVSEAAQAIDLIQAFGDTREPRVKWTDPNYLSQMKQAEELGERV